MRFVIRDDDTNYFTSPEELNYCYSAIWHDCPVSISVITHVKGDWKHWVDEIYKSGNKTDWSAWEKDQSVYELGKNTDLVTFIKDKIQTKKVCLTFHAIHHRNEDDFRLGAVKNNYVHGAEFYTTRNLVNEVSNAIQYLNNLFQTEVKVFTPPQNLLSEMGYEAIVKNDLNIIGGGISFLKKEKTLRGILNIFRVGFFKLIRFNKDYPYVLEFKRHKEFIHYYPLYPNTRIESLLIAFENAYALKGDFILSTHYNEFKKSMTYNNSIIMKDVFYEFMDHVKKKKDVSFVTANELFR